MANQSTRSTDPKMEFTLSSSTLDDIRHSSASFPLDWKDDASICDLCNFVNQRLSAYAMPIIPISDESIIKTFECSALPQRASELIHYTLSFIGQQLDALDMALVSVSHKDAWSDMYDLMVVRRNESIQLLNNKNLSVHTF